MRTDIPECRMQLLDIERRSDINAAAAVGRPGSGTPRRVFIETYGCQMNVSDTELMMGVLKKRRIPPGIRALEDADVVLLNTCAIRERAEERVVGRLSQLSRLKRARPDLVLGVSGCMAKHLAEELLNRVAVRGSRGRAGFLSAPSRADRRSCRESRAGRTARPGTRTIWNSIPFAGRARMPGSRSCGDATSFARFASYPTCAVASEVCARGRPVATGADGLLRRGSWKLPCSVQTVNSYQ